MTPAGVDMVVKNNYAFITGGGGTAVYDISNFSSFNKLTTLINKGQHIELYENLLIVGGDSLFVYDISNINSIQMVAIFTAPRHFFKVDKATDYLYLLQNGGSSLLNVIDLSKYVVHPNRPPVFTNAPDPIKVADTQTVTWTTHATDPDGDKPTFTFNNLPGYITKTNDSTISIAPGKTDNNTTVRVIASDGKGGLDTFDLRVIVDHPVTATLATALRTMQPAMHAAASKNCIVVHYSTGNSGQKAILAIYSVNGSVIKRTALPFSSGIHTYTWSHASAGVYFVRLTSGNTEITNKVIIE